MAPRARCPLCGAVNEQCGPSGHPAAVSIIPTERSRTVMAELKTYTYTDAEGRQVSLRLTEEDARRRGVTQQTKAAQPPPNKSRAAADK
jgi:hypothetical protein